MEYDFWTMRESPFHQLSDFQCIFLFAFGEVKIICAFVTFSADPIYCDTKAGGDLWTCLPRARRKRRRRCPRQAGRGRGKIPNQRMIDTRPAEVETRKRVGHWEGDLINGARETGHLSTLVERCTRYTLIDRTDSKEGWR